jgi:hypothetical protein
MHAHVIGHLEAGSWSSCNCQVSHIVSDKMSSDPFLHSQQIQLATVTHGRPIGTAR